MEEQKMNDKTEDDRVSGNVECETVHSLLSTTEKTVNRKAVVMTTDPRRFHLYLSAFILNLNYLLCGVGFAWSSPVLGKLPQLSKNEGSTIASMLPLGSILGPFISAPLLYTIGRKGTVGLNVVLITTANLVLTFAEPSVFALSTGRFITGIMCGITFSVVPMYIAEISENSVRGLLNTLSQAFCCAGSLMVYVIGPFASYSQLHYIILSLCAALLLFFPLLPNSPYYLVMKKDVDGALACLKWLREERSEAFIDKELEEIQETIKQNIADKTSVTSLFTVKGNLKSLAICTSLIVLQQLTGITLIFFYFQMIISMTGTNLKDSTCSIVIGVIMLVSAFISPLSVKYFGYKKPLLASSLGMFFGMAGLGVFFLLKSNKLEVEEIGWLPLLSIVLYILFFNAGFSNIPWAMSGELFPSPIRPAATFFISVFGGIFAFLCTFLFPDLIDLLGFDFLFLTCAFFSCFAFVFVMMVVKDTSGMSFAEIQLMLNTPKKKDQKINGLV